MSRDAGSDVEQLQALKHAYLRHIDLKQWDEFGALFTPDATGSYAELTFSSRDGIVDYLRETAETIVELVFVPAYDVAIEGAAFYSDRMARTPEGWRFTQVGYRRTFEASWTMSAVPGWSFEVGTAYDG